MAWTVTHKAAAPRLPERLRSWTPYVLVVVRFPGFDGVLLPAILRDADPGADLAGAEVVLDGGESDELRLTARLVTA